MVTKMIRFVSKHILLAPLMLVLLLFGCKSQKLPIVTQSEKTMITVTERKIPVFTPGVKVNARGKIYVDHNGFPRLGDVSITTDSDKPQPKKPKVSVELDSLGNLKIDVAISEDTTRVSVSDTTRNTEIVNTRYVERELAWWQKTFIYLGILLFLYILFKLAINSKK